jgi:predicted PurR-regulated permease PerM
MLNELRPNAAQAARVQWQRLALVVVFLLVLWLCLRLFSSILMPFVTAAGVAYFLDPAVTRLAKHGVRRSIGAFLILLALLLFVALFVLLLYPIISNQGAMLVANLPSYIKTAQGLFGSIITDLQERLGPGAMSQKLKDLATNQAGTIISFAGTTASNIIGSGFAVVNVLTLLVITPIVAFYFLRDWPGIVRHVDTWLPRPYEGVIRSQAIEVNRILAAWIRGQAIGTIVGAVSAVLLAVSQNPGWHQVLLVLGVFAFGQALNDYFIQPRFLGDRVGLPAVWVIFSLFAGGAAFGFLGIMLAVPVTATLGVLARFWLRRYLHSPLYLDAPP